MSEPSETPSEHRGRLVSLTSHPGSSCGRLRGDSPAQPVDRSVGPPYSFPLTEMNSRVLCLRCTPPGTHPALARSWDSRGQPRSLLGFLLLFWTGLVLTCCDGLVAPAMKGNWSVQTIVATRQSILLTVEINKCRWAILFQNFPGKLHLVLYSLTWRMRRTPQF